MEMSQTERKEGRGGEFFFHILVVRLHQQLSYSALSFFSHTTTQKNIIHIIILWYSFWIHLAQQKKLWDTKLYHTYCSRDYHLYFVFHSLKWKPNFSLITSWPRKWTRNSRNNSQRGRNWKLSPLRVNGNDWTTLLGSLPVSSEFTYRKCSKLATSRGLSMWSTKCTQMTYF